jgi:thioredoxin-dependent peroxiredoxin
VVEEGKPAPEFELATDTGETVSLASLRGKNVVLYFYPKDDTPGCTAQACAIRDSMSDFQNRNAVVLGVSPDDEASHRKFKEKYSLPFTLLADPGHQVAEEYGVWVEKKRVHAAPKARPHARGERGGAEGAGVDANYGKKYMGIERSTFVIDPEGKVKKVLRRVDPQKHADQVLELLGE